MRPICDAHSHKAAPFSMRCIHCGRMVDGGLQPASDTVASELFDRAMEKDADIDGEDFYGDEG